MVSAFHPLRTSGIKGTSSDRGERGMIGLAFLLLFAAPEPEPEAELRRDTMTYAMPPVEVTPEIAPMVDTYYRCAFPDAFGKHQVAMGKEEANTRARIAACGEVRKWAVAA